jgi:hypothetical protein
MLQNLWVSRVCPTQGPGLLTLSRKRSHRRLDPLASPSSTVILSLSKEKGGPDKLKSYHLATLLSSQASPNEPERQSEPNALGNT